MKTGSLLVSILLAVAVMVGIISGGCAKPAPPPTPAAAPPAVAPTPAPAPPPKPTPSTPAPAPAAPIQPKTLKIACKPAGSDTYAMAVAVAKVVSRYAKTEASPAAYGTSAVFPKHMDEGKIDMAVINTLDSGNAMRGLGMWKGAPYTAGRFIAYFYPMTVATFAVRGLGVKTMADLKGKKFMNEYAGSVSSEEIYGAIYDAYGLTKQNVIGIPYRSGDEIAPAITEGRADAAIWYFTGTTPWLKELLVTKALDFISLDDKAISKIVAEHPIVPGVIPARSYKGQDEPWKGIGVPQTLAGRVTLPDDLVYDIVAAIYDHFDEYVSYYGPLAASVLPGAISPVNFKIPVHAGAVMYYKERGWWKKEHDDKQAELLKELKLQK